MAFPLIGYVGLGLLGLLVGCRDSSEKKSPSPGAAPPKPPETKSVPAPSPSAATTNVKPAGPDAFFRTELAAKTPGSVKILQIRDLHGMIDGEDPTKVAPKIFVAMGNYQRNILALLEKKNPRHLFTEGFSHDTKSSELKEIIRKKFGDFDKVENLVLKGSPETALGMELATWQTVLFYLGAANVYALRHPEVTLHRCASPEENNQAYQFFLNGYLPYMEKHGENYDAPIMGTTFRKMNEKREDWVTREVRQWINSPEGKHLRSDEELVIYFGSAHSFCDNFAKAGLDAQLLSVYWAVEHPGYQKLLLELMPKACVPATIK